jgi:hypothetical protein
MPREYIDRWREWDEIDLFWVRSRIELSRTIGEVCRERCRDKPFPEKVRCVNDCESHLFILATHSFANFVELMLYPPQLTYELERERLLLYTDKMVDMYDEYYGAEW